MEKIKISINPTKRQGEMRNILGINNSPEVSDAWRLPKDV